MLSSDPQDLPLTAELYGGGSAVYIGADLFLSAHHVGAGPIRTYDSDGAILSSHAISRQSFVVSEFTDIYRTPWGTLYPAYDIQVIQAKTFDPDAHAGSASRMLIAADPDDLSGDVVLTGFADATGAFTVMEGVLNEDHHWSRDIEGIAGGHFQIDEVVAQGGMSGGGTYLSTDLDGRVPMDDYLIGINVAVGFTTTTAVSISAHYQALTAHLAAIGTDADEIPRPVLLSGQRAGSASFEVQGSFLHEDIIGGDFDDRIRAMAGDDMATGADGADRIFGGRGHDSLYGGAGSDLLVGGRGRDIVTGDAGADRLRGGGGDDALSGGGGDDTLSGQRGDDLLAGGRGDDTLSGGRGDDRLVTGPGADVAMGGTGDDVLIAGPGANTLTGGAGADTFVFADRDQDAAVTDYADGDVLLIGFADTAAAFQALDPVYDAETQTLTWTGGGLIIAPSNAPPTGIWIGETLAEADWFLFA